MNVRIIRTNSLKPSPFNPDERTRRENLSFLLASMKAEGFHPYQPLIVTNELVIADGHRRWTCAVILKIESVPCFVITDKTAAQLWSGINGTMRTPTKRETIQAVAHGLDHYPPNKRAAIEQVIEAFGMEGILKLAANNLSPYTVSIAKRVAKHCNLPDDSEFLNMCFSWLVDLRQQKNARQAVEQGMPPDELLDKITQNKPLRFW